MIPSSLRSLELQNYLAREWNADVGFLVREEENRRAKEKSKPKKAHKRHLQFPNVLRHLFARRVRHHR